MSRPLMRQATLLRAARKAAEQGDKWAAFEALGYQPAFPEQQAIHESNAPRKVVRFGRRGGKTLACAMELVVGLLKAQTRYWIVAPDHELTERVWREVKRVLLDDLGITPVRMREAPPREMLLPWGAYLAAKSTEHASQKNLVGDSLDGIVWDECAKSPGRAWELRLQPNLADRHGWAILASTPEGLNHFQTWWERGQAPYDARQRGEQYSPPANEHIWWESFYAPSSENPHCPNEAIEEAQRTFSPEAFSQEFDANFVHFAGQVYPEFNTDQHVTRLHHDPSLPVCLAFDFGTTAASPFVCLWIQPTPDGEIRVLNEYVQAGETTLENGLAVLDEHDRREYGSIAYCAGDPSGRDARLTLQRECGIRNIDYHRHARETGIEAVRGMLKNQELTVDTGCRHTIREFNLYRRPDQQPQAEVVKADDHCMDALRYFVAVWKWGRGRRR